MKTLVISLLLLASSLATAGEKLGYLNWVADLSGQDNEAYTIPHLACFALQINAFFICIKRCVASQEKNTPSS